jgi:hypothetical protein
LNTCTTTNGKAEHDERYAAVNNPEMHNGDQAIFAEYMATKFINDVEECKGLVMKILITGHKGFVGRNFVKALPDSDITGIDLKDGNDCRDFFKTNTDQFDLVIHLAAIVGGRATIEGEPLSVATDLSIDAEFFNWVQSTKPKNVVYFSSSAAYPIDLQTTHRRHRLAEHGT